MKTLLGQSMNIGEGEVIMVCQNSRNSFLREIFQFEFL